jgi:hypothetical protein
MVEASAMERKDNPKEKIKTSGFGFTSSPCGIIKNEETNIATSTNGNTLAIPSNIFVVLVMPQRYAENFVALLIKCRTTILRLAMA